MTKQALTIFRTAFGSPPSVTGCLYLQKMGHRVIAGDCDELSVGFCVADASYLLPRVDDPDYINTLLEICNKEKVELFLPSLDEELILVSENKTLFESVGTKVIISPYETLKKCVDKYETYLTFQQNNIPCIQTFLVSEVQSKNKFGFPMIVKPRTGRGSTGVYKVENEFELNFFSQYISNVIIQPFISGIEYTVDILADYNSTLKVVSPRKRLATDSGISSKGMTFWNQQIVEWIFKIVKSFGIVGPANVQCFVTSNGETFFSEINARFAGTSILSEVAGVPLFEGICAMARNETIEEFIKPVKELIMLRYWEEKYIQPDKKLCKNL
jgi:carbamoyl-phosphate synthase large subunit